MDAVTLAAAALPIAVDDSRDAALRQAMLERERLAMAAGDRDSFLAQRYFTGSRQLRGAAGHRPQTWQAAYEVRDDNFEQALDPLREVRAANRQGDAERINDIVAMELGYSSDEEPAQPPELGGSSDEADSSDEVGDRDEEPAPQRQSHAANRALGKSPNRAAPGLRRLRCGTVSKNSAAAIWAARTRRRNFRKPYSPADFPQNAGTAPQSAT